MLGRVVAKPPGQAGRRQRAARSVRMRQRRKAAALVCGKGEGNVPHQMKVQAAKSQEAG